MHTISMRTLSALAYDRGEEFDPGQPVSAQLVESLSLLDHAWLLPATPSGSSKPAKARRSAAAAIPAWFSAEDLITRPWETARSHPV